MNGAASDLDSPIRQLLPDLERVSNLHAHPEPSMQETRTAGVAADRLCAAAFDVTLLWARRAS
jgi:metal-dependent amidase/aminoacylase/carboxypeptidase family protein